LQTALTSLHILLEKFRKMRVAIVFLALISVVNGFRVAPSRINVKSVRLFSEEPTTQTSGDPSEAPKDTGLVLLEKNNIETAAAVTGGFVGFAVGGPVVRRDMKCL
jgi:hypothetical protein